MQPLRTTETAHLNTQSMLLPQFVQVAVPVHLTKTFTYRLPPSMQRVARVGSRVMIQLGTKPTTGYVVALLTRLRAGTSLIESEIKDVQELLDAEPPLTPQVLEITHWVANYYAAPWGEVLRAALPAGINATVEQTVSITEEGREELKSVPPAGGSAKLRALRLLADEGVFEVSAFGLLMGAGKTAKWLRELEHDGLIQRSYRTRSTVTRAKRRRAVRLVKSSADADETVRQITNARQQAIESQPKMQAGRLRSQLETKAQQRAIEILRANQDELAVSDLVKQARVSESVIRTLLKRGVVEEFDQEIRRDPLAQAELPDMVDLKLTAEQTSALLAIQKPMRERRFAPILLHGVTGSGKTEVYIRAMRAALDMNQGAMMLVPEIALTPILSRRLRAHFGDQIAIFHSSLSKGERFDEWSRLRSGEARVVLGTRSPGDVFPQHRCYGRMQVPFPFARIIEASKPLKPGLRDPQYVQRLIDLAQELEDGQDQKRLFQCVKWRSSSPKSSHTQFFWLEGPTAEYRFPPRIMRVRPHAVKGLGCEGANA